MRAVRNQFGLTQELFARLTGKRPCLDWKVPPTWERMEPYWDNPRTTGLAVILGAVSGNLSARDFDRLDSYERWRDEHPDLAAVLPTVWTPRPGRHLFKRTAGPCRTQRFDDGELRGHRGIVVLPPSRHPGGQCYVWAIDPGQEIPLVEPTKLIGAAKPKQRRSSSAASTVLELSQPESEMNGETSTTTHAPDLTHATHATGIHPTYSMC